jgi:enoyl-CoA hydratase/carnithine racemase
MTGLGIARRSVGAVTVLELQHGPVNALDLEFCRSLTSELSAATGVVVLTGQGRVFSAGVDLSRLVMGGVDYVEEFLPALDELFRTAFALPVPLIRPDEGAAARRSPAPHRVSVARADPPAVVAQAG